MKRLRVRQSGGFSLVEVVIALGVVAFAIIAILGVIPIGLKTSHSAQDQTRSAQITQDILASIASQAQTNFPNVVIKQTSTAFSYTVDLSTARQYDTLAADNEGRLIALTNVNQAMQYPYQVLMQIDPSPAGFDSGYASKVTVRVVTPPSPNPSTSPSSAQSFSDTVRIISKY